MEAGERDKTAMIEKFIGIGYSGSGTPVTRTPGLQVYAATNDGLPQRVKAREWGRRVKAHGERRPRQGT
ncbi:MAG: hypothetical protein ACOX1P_03860 [Thermoguttaceae bacterium]|jgi:hypothetical protein